MRLNASPMIIQSLLLLTLFCGVAGCSAKKFDLTTDTGTIQEGDRYMDDEFFEEARKQFFRVKTEFPTSALQVQADLKIAESYYREESYVSAAQAYEDFLKTYPGRPEIPEAIYSLGMCYVKQMPSTPQRDTKATTRVVDIFTRLMVDYPNSPHIQEAQKAVERARDQLASKIFQIARFYERMKDYESAARRYAEVIDQYAESKYVQEAAARQIRCLYKASKNEKAAELARTFQEKFPQSEFKSMITP